MSTVWAVALLYKSIWYHNGAETFPLPCLGVGEVAVGKLVKLSLLSSANEFTDVLDTLHHSTLLLFWGGISIGFLHLQNDLLENLHSSLILLG